MIDNLEIKRIRNRFWDIMSNNKQKLKKCVKCQLPETYETIEFDKSGTCNICEESKKKENIDWGKRKLLLDIMKRIEENMLTTALSLFHKG